MDKTYRRGDIYFANLGPIVGSEQDGLRPVLIIQNNVGNRFSPTTIIAPISSRVNARANLPTHIFLPDALQVPSVALLEQIRTLDKRRLARYIGKLDAGTMRKVNEKICISLGIPNHEFS